MRTSRQGIPSPLRVKEHVDNIAMLTIHREASMRDKMTQASRQDQFLPGQGLRLLPPPPPPFWPPARYLLPWRILFPEHILTRMYLMIYSVESVVPTFPHRAEGSLGT